MNIWWKESDNGFDHKGCDTCGTITQGRRQSQTSILSTNVEKIVRNRVFDCQMKSKTLFLTIFDPRSSIVKSVFDCHLPGVNIRRLFTIYFNQKAFGQLKNDRQNRGVSAKNRKSITSIICGFNAAFKWRFAGEPMMARQCMLALDRFLVGTCNLQNQLNYSLTYG